MANRIQKPWDDIIKWKRFFENLASGGKVSADFNSSRPVRKELLKKYNELLNRRYKNLSPDERSVRRLVNRERRLLERELYPNVFIRTARNLTKLAAAIVAFPFRAIANPIRAERAERGIRTDLSKRGFGNLSADIGARVRQGEHAINEKMSESPSPKEIIDYNLSISGGIGKQQLQGFSATLTTVDGKEKRSLSMEDSLLLTKEQAGGLLHGRAINVGGNKWKIPDINDADASGNIRIREIRIPGFDLENSIRRIPNIKLSEDQLFDIIQDLKNGKRVELPDKGNNQFRNVQIEAAPLQRGLNFFENNKRTNLDRIIGKETNSKTLTMDTPKRKIGKAVRM